MKTKQNGLWQAIRTVILLGTVSVAALANQGPALLSSPATPLCYCHCAYETGMKHCTKMCELPQYQSRWWATSCHKKSAASTVPSAQAPATGSRKTNRKERASL
jgi:hypothetical protein